MRKKKKTIKRDGEEGGGDLEREKKTSTCLEERRAKQRCLDNYASLQCSALLGSGAVTAVIIDRKSVVEGKSVDLGGGRSIKKKKQGN